jgi:FGGY family of carbohydrate kinases, C-terminal domain
MPTKADQPASWTDLARRVRASPFTARFSTATAWFSRISAVDNWWQKSRLASATRACALATLTLALSRFLLSSCLRDSDRCARRSLFSARRKNRGEVIFRPSDRTAKCFSNEAGVDGTTRFLRNVTGFWLLQECVREWRAEGRSVDLDELNRAAGRVAGPRALIDVQDPVFLPPGGMTQRIIQACLRSTGVVLSSEAEILRCILDSMAVAIRHAVRDAVRLTARPVRTVHIVGGGVANPLFCQLVADACQLPVVAGPTEAACWATR